MKGKKTRIIVVLLLAAAALLAAFLLREYLPSLDQVKAHKEQLLSFIKTHYLLAVLTFMGLYFSTALFLPGALALSVAGGLMFGTLPAALYVNIAATSGALLAFVTSRFLLSEWIQGRFQTQLARFNAEMERHGPSYLLVLRILPLLPFFAVNYCAGITKIPLRTFLWTTSLGIIPGSLIHAYIGQQLRRVNALQDLFSWKILLALGTMALVALVPVIHHHLPGGKG
jgi:uncharacterized membrane protein YdjX (TVP38/TMEM64 family)